MRPPGRSRRWSSSRARGSARPPTSRRRTRTGRRRCERSRAMRDRSTRRPARASCGCTGWRVRRNARWRRPPRQPTFARTIGFPVVVKAQAPEIPHKAKLGGVRLGLRNPTDVEVAAAEVLEARLARRCSRAEGARAADGARHGGARRRRGRRALRTDDHRAARAARSPSRGRRCSCRARSRPPRRARSWPSRPRTAVSTPTRTTCGRRPGRSRSIARITHDLRDRLTSFEANPLLVGERGAVAVDALAEVATRVIFGLTAALGWGLADFTGAVGGRRIGSLPTVMIAQLLSAVAMTAFMIAGRARARACWPPTSRSSR